LAVPPGTAGPAGPARRPLTRAGAAARPVTGPGRRGLCPALSWKPST